MKQTARQKDQARKSQAILRKMSVIDQDLLIKLPTLELTPDEKMPAAGKREWVQKQLYGDIKEGMRQLIFHIQDSGELDKYWQRIQKQNEIDKLLAKKVEKNRKKIKMASEYVTSGDEQTYDIDSWDEESKTHSNDTEYYSQEEGKSEFKDFSQDYSPGFKPMRRKSEQKIIKLNELPSPLIGISKESESRKSQFKRSPTQRQDNSSIITPNFNASNEITQEDQTNTIEILSPTQEMRTQGPENINSITSSHKKKKPLPFNALRFLGMKLKEIQDTKHDLRKQKSNFIIEESSWSTSNDEDC